MGSFAATVQLNCLHYRKTMLQQCSSRVTPEESQTVGGLSSWLPGDDFFAKCYDYKDEDIHHVIKLTSYDHETANMLKMKMFTEWSTVKAKVAS